MEKYSFVSKDKDIVSALRSCNSEKNVNLKFNRKEKKWFYILNPELYIQFKIINKYLAMIN